MEFLVCWSGQYIYVCVNVCCLLPLQPPPLLLCSSFLTVRCRFVCCLSHCSPSPHLHSLTAPSPSCLSVCLSLSVRLSVCLFGRFICLLLFSLFWFFSLSLSRSLSVFLLPVFALPLLPPPPLHSHYSAWQLYIFMLVFPFHSFRFLLSCLPSFSPLSSPSSTVSRLAPPTSVLFSST